MRKTSLFLVSMVAVAVSVAIPHAASAATTEEIAQNLLSRVSKALGIKFTDPDLLDELSDGLEYAIEDGSIPEAITDEISDDIDSGSESDGLDGTIDANLIDQIANWEDYAPVVKVAFNAVRAEFQACRTAAGSARACAQGLGFKMQVAIATDSLERLSQLEAQLAADGVVLTEEEIAALEAERAELLAKIERANAKLAALDSSDPAVQNAKNEMARIRDAVDELEESASSVEQGAPGNSAGKGNSGANGSEGSKGKAGGNGNGNGGGSGNGKP